MNEKGFLIGLAHAVKVIVHCARKEEEKSVGQTGNRELVTVIEGISCYSYTQNSFRRLVSWPLALKPLGHRAQKAQSQVIRLTSYSTIYRVEFTTYYTVTSTLH